MMKKIVLFVVAAAAILSVTACNSTDALSEGNLNIEAQMEKSNEDWVQILADEYGIKDAGKPVGASGEKYLEKNHISEIDFVFRENVEQKIIDSYAQSIWNACSRIDHAGLRNERGIRYDSMAEAHKDEAPYDFYVWYYEFGEELYRVEICGAEFEKTWGIALILQQYSGNMAN